MGSLMSSEHRRAKMREYRAAHKKRWLLKNKVVYGSMGHGEWEEMSAIARRSGRTVWQEVWCESKAWRRQRFLPTKDIEARIERLYIELRRIGVNVNQVAKAANAGLPVDRAVTGREIAKLEQAISQFVAKPWGQDGGWRK